MNFVERILEIFQFRKVGKFRKRTRSGPHIAFQKLELIGNSSGFDSGIGKVGPGMTALHWALACQ
jgi:hypothetical protein